MGLRGILSGALALIALQVLVQPAAAGRVSGLWAGVADLAGRFLDPTRPAIGGVTASHSVTPSWWNRANTGPLPGLGGGIPYGAPGFPAAPSDAPADPRRTGGGGRSTAN